MKKTLTLISALPLVLLGLTACQEQQAQASTKNPNGTELASSSNSAMSNSTQNYDPSSSQDATGANGGEGLTPSATDRSAQLHNDMAQADKRIESGAKSIGKDIADATITMHVNAKLATDDSLSAFKINVDTNHGIVTLKGPAPTATAKKRATMLVLSIKGVKGVDNELKIQG